MAKGKEPPREIIARIDALVEAQTAVNEIIRLVWKEFRYKISRGPVDKRVLLARANWRRGRPSDEGLGERVRELSAQGKKAPAIAAELGIGRTLVYYYLKQATGDSSETE